MNTFTFLKLLNIASFLRLSWSIDLLAVSLPTALSNRGRLPLQSKLLVSGLFSPQAPSLSNFLLFSLSAQSTRPVYIDSWRLEAGSDISRRCLRRGTQGAPRSAGGTRRCPPIAASSESAADSSTFRIAEGRIKYCMVCHWGSDVISHRNIGSWTGPDCWSDCSRGADAAARGTSPPAASPRRTAPS